MAFRWTIHINDSFTTVRYTFLTPGGNSIKDIVSAITNATNLVQETSAHQAFKMQHKDFCNQQSTTCKGLSCDDCKIIFELIRKAEVKYEIAGKAIETICITCKFKDYCRMVSVETTNCKLYTPKTTIMQ